MSDMTLAASGKHASATALPVLRMKNIRKSFGPVVALKDVGLTVLAGQVHAIVGENGAGKSTLISCAAGVLKPDAGTIEIGGEVCAPDPQKVRDLGLSTAFQHPSLAPDLTVLENLQLVCANLSGEEAAALIARVTTPALSMDLRARASELSLAQRHALEIARALASRPKVLILDEPTEPFQEPEVRHLFALIRQLTREGAAVIYISHRLHEVMELADHISVLRDGEMIDSRPAANFTPADIITLIVGRPLGQVFPAKSVSIGGAPILTAALLSGAGFTQVSLDVRPGEIVGLAGVEGQGQREFLRCLAGLSAAQSGDLRVAGNVLKGGGARLFRNAGVGFVPDDRHREGLVLEMSIKENEGLGQLKQLSRFGFIDARKEASAANDISKALRVKAASIDTPVSQLSGGNQQKVLIGREISFGAKVLLVDEPTKGVDVGSRSDIYQKLRGLADEGIGVIVASADGIEVEGLCDRVLIFSRGAVVAELTGAEVTDERITAANLQATATREGGQMDAKIKAGSRIFTGDAAPAAALAILTIILSTATQAVNPDFLSAYNLQSTATLLAILSLFGFAQLLVVLTGGIDLSVGPLAGLVVVLASFVLTPDTTSLGLVGGVLGILAACCVVGLLHAALIEGLKLPSIVVTLATFTGIQGLSLVLRPFPDGRINETFMTGAQALIGGVPVAFLGCVFAAALMQWVLVRRPVGRALRAVGSDARSAKLVGLRRLNLGVIAFVSASLLTGIGGLLLAAQVGIGSPTTGVSYTLSSVTAVVLGGAQITGGRGSFLCTLLGAALIQVVTAAVPFLNLEATWQYWILGGATFLAAGFYGRLRRLEHAH